MEKIKINKFRSLTVSLITAFLALSILVLLIVSLLEIFFNISTQQKNVTDNIHFIASDAASTVKSFIQGKYILLETAVRLSDLATTTTQEKQKLVLEKLLGSESSFRHLVLFSPDRQELTKVSLFSTFIPVQLSDQIKNEMFQKINSDKRYISPVYIDSDNSEPMVIIAVSINDILGDYKGVLMAELNLKYMWNVVGNIKVGNKGTAYVVDRNGTLLAYSDLSRVLKGEKLTSLPQVAKFIQKKSETTGAFGGLSNGISGNKVVSNLVPLGTPDWAVVVELPFFEAYQTVIYQLEFTGLLIIFNIILTVAIGIVLSKRITKPIINLRDAAENIKQGKFETRIDIQSTNEIGQLADSFNQMAQNLQQSYTILEEKVKERTGELEETKKKMEIVNSDLEKRVTERTSELEQLKNNLEKNVAERTDQLNQSMLDSKKTLSLLTATLDSTADGILVVNQSGKVESYNKRFIELWQIPRELAEQKDDQKLLDFVKVQLADSDQFISKVKELYAHPEQECFDVLKLKDGRIFERHSQPLKLENTITGRVWSFRDATVRRTAEEELKKRADELERMNKLMVGRELKMVELKNEIESLKMRSNTS